MALWPPIDVTRELHLDLEIHLGSESGIKANDLVFPASLRTLNDETTPLPEAIKAELLSVANFTAAEKWLFKCTLSEGWLSCGFPLTVASVTTIIRESGFELVYGGSDVELQMLRRMLYGDQITSLNEATNGPMLAADKVHFFPKSWLKRLEKEFYADALTSAAISEEHMIGVFWIKGRDHRVYHCYLNKHQFGAWLRGKTECVVCYEETGFGDDIIAAQMCYECGTKICLSCFVDLVMIAEANGATDGRFKCTICRTEQCGPLTTTGRYLESARIFEDFDAAKKSIVRKWAARYKLETAPKSKAMEKPKPKRPRRDGCQKCGKVFWDKKAYKQAAKCKRCKAPYCNAKCRKAHRKEHSKTCAC